MPHSVADVLRFADVAVQALLGALLAPNGFWAFGVNIGEIH
jgi:hypothetical protein